MKKITKGTILGLLLVVLSAGAVYAAYLLWNQSTNTTVIEPISVTWGFNGHDKLPETTFPNQEYSFGFCIHNAATAGNGNQNIGFVVTNSNNLTRVNLSLGDWNTKNTLTLARDSEQCVEGTVKTPSDMVPGAAWVNIQVSRE